MVEKKKTRKSLKHHPKRAVGTYLVLLLVAAILLLLIAHLTQEHAFAVSTASSLLSH